MDSGAWWATVHGVAKSQTTEHNGLSVVVLDNFRYRYYLTVHKTETVPKMILLIHQYTQASPMTYYLGNSSKPLIFLGF